MMKTALILEDDDIQRKILEVKLSQHKIDFVSFADYDAALDKIKNNTFSCYFIDINLGNKNTGIDFIREIKNRDNALIFITSNFEIKTEVHNQASKLLGFEGFETDQIEETTNIHFFVKPLDYV